MARYFTCRNPKQKITYKSEHLELNKLETNLLKQSVYRIVRNHLTEILEYVKESDLEYCAVEVEELTNLIDIIFNIYEGIPTQDSKLLDFLMYFYEEAFTYIDEPPYFDPFIECLKLAEIKRHQKSEETSIFD